MPLDAFSLSSSLSLGESHLTFKEAQDTEEEVYQLLRDEFDEPFFKPALEVVHHNVGTIDDLVKRAWERFHQEYHVNLGNLLVP